MIQTIGMIGTGNMGSAILRGVVDAGYIRELAGKNAEAASVYAMVADASDIMPDLRAEGAYAAGRMFLQLKNETAARKYLSMFDPMKVQSPVASQWAMLAQAQLNRMATPKVNAVSGKSAAKPAPAKKAAPAAKPAPAKKAAPKK